MLGWVKWAVFDLPQKPLGTYDRGDLMPEHFECDGAAVLEFVGQVYRRHPAPSELALDAVTVGDGGPKRLKRVIVHEGLPGTGSPIMEAGEGARKHEQLGPKE